MILVLMYHQIADPKQPENLSKFRRHLQELAYHFPNVLPGESITKRKLNICLTFDDAYYDFYHHIFPLLQEFNMKAVLGIPTERIKSKTAIPAKERLTIPYPEGLNLSVAARTTPLCTWEEIAEMVNSGFVEPASHSHTHANLLEPTSHLDTEIIYSKQEIFNRLGVRPKTFIYPFGKMNRQLQKKVQPHYDYSMRIGSALNLKWQQRDGLLYRIDADHLWKTNTPLNLPKIIQYGLKGLSNWVRFK